MRFTTFFTLGLSPLLIAAAPLVLEVFTSTNLIVVQPTQVKTIVVTKTTTLPSISTTSIAHTSATPIAAVNSEEKLTMAYYPDWAGESFPPEKIDFTRFDWIDFAFALPNKDFGLTWDDNATAPQLLSRLVAAAHAAGKKVKLSIGGWTGSRHFSPAVATPESRLIFVNNILKTYTAYNLDGIDIDWEYPGQPGNNGNLVDPQNDTANYLLFLQLLRQTLPSIAKISAAALSQPWIDGTGVPLSDMTGFAAVLDWVLIMNYDVWGSSATPGPNAPLSNACGNSSQPNASADAAIRSWTAAGFPTHKLTLGLPSYGYVSKSHALILHGRAVTVQNEDGSVGEGQVQFRELLRQGAIAPTNGKPGAAKFEGAGGYTRHWDECSSTPYLRADGASVVITYDDPESLTLKGELANSRGLLGVNIFDVHGDTDNWDLIDAARAAFLH